MKSGTRTIFHYLVKGHHREHHAPDPLDVARCCRSGHLYNQARWYLRISVYCRLRLLRMRHRRFLQLPRRRYQIPSNQLHVSSLRTPLDCACCALNLFLCLFSCVSTPANPPAAPVKNITDSIWPSKWTANVSAWCVIHTLVYTRACWL